MSDLNNKINNSNAIIVNSQISWVEIILNFWKFKIVFIYFFISLTIFFFFLNNFIPKNTITEIRFKDGNNSLTIDLNSELSGLDTATHEILSIAHMSTLFATNTSTLFSTNGIDLSLANFFSKKFNQAQVNWQKDYFYKNLISSKNLNRFTKNNENEYKLYDYIYKNNILVKEKKNNHFSLILPEEINTIKFFSDYISYINDLSLELLKKDLIQFENNKIKIIERELSEFKKIYYSNNSVILNEDEVKQYLSLIEVMLEPKISSIKNKISYISDLKTYDIEEDILYGPISKKVTTNHQRIIFVSPIFFSLIFYFFYLLFKIEKQNKLN